MNDSSRTGDGGRDEFGYGEHDKERAHPNDPKAHSTPPRRVEGDTSRSAFQRDYDRLVFSGAYRRLQGKTQVVTPGEADFFRNRLTHSIEVAQIARRLAEMLNGRVVSGTVEGISCGGSKGFVDPDVCAAASALHDFGHPPFGHVGEEELHAAVCRRALEYGLTGDLEEAAQLSGGYNGNAQSLRMAVHSLTHKEPGGGLELTRAVLDGTLKYPWAYDERPAGKGGWNVFPTEREQFAWIRDRVPEELRQQRSIEAQIVDWADDIAYAIHDLEDWFRAGYFPLVALTTPGSSTIDELCAKLDQRWPEDDTDEFVKYVLLDPEGGFGAFRELESVTDPHGYTGREAMRKTRSALYDECFKSTSVKVASAEALGISPRHALGLEIPKEVRRKNKLLRELLRIYLVGSHRLATQQRGQRHIVRSLFELHDQAADPEDTSVSLEIFRHDVRGQIEKATEAGDRLLRLRLVCDYVSGMTDAYAIRLHNRLFGGESIFHEFI